jgi:DNA-binding response OmpR family regulator
MLEMCGFEVRTAFGGRAAVETAAQFRPEFALLDIGLPGWDGYEVARRLRAEAGLESLTFIAVTAYGTEDDRRRSREAGFADHLVKPISPGELLGLLSRSKGVDS